MTPERDPVDLLREALQRSHLAGEIPDGLRDRVLESRPAIDGLNQGGRRPTRGLRRPLFLVLGGLIAAGCVAAATVALRGQPTRPEIGIACRSGPAANADVVAAPAAADALAACAALWASGRLPDVDGTTVGGTVPLLTACIGSGGLVEVFPNLDSCGTLGLEPADLVLSPENQRVLEFQDRISTLNLDACLDEGELRSKIEELLDELSLSDWTVATTPSMASPSSGCVKGQVDASLRVVELFIV